MTATPYQKRVYQQGIDWVNGKPVHNTVDDECCPDFSCCFPTLFETDKKIRIAMHNKFATFCGLPLVPEIKPAVKGINHV